MGLGAAEIAIIGGGAFGLWSALAAGAAGARVVLLEAGPALLAGASATPVGALTPFPFARPDDPLARFQAEALMTMPAAMAAVERLGGRPAGYRLAGRASPLDDAAALARAEAQAAEGRRRLPRRPDGAAASWRVGAAAIGEAGTGLFAPGTAAAGWLSDDVSASVEAAACGTALAAAAAALPGVECRTGWPVDRLAREGGAWRIEGPAGVVRAGAVIVAAGWRAGLLAATAAPRAPGPAADAAKDGAGETAAPAARPDRPVKGQAARLALPPGALPDDLPVIQAPGLFVVHHGGGLVGIGATSEAGRSDGGTDAGLDDVLARAAALMPVLAEGRVAQRWAGVRPRPPGRLPRLGEAADAPGLWHASGGFKIGLALAHRAGPAVAAAALGLGAGAPLGPFGAAPGLPAAFAPGRLGLAEGA